LIALSGEVPGLSNSSISTCSAVKSLIALIGTFFLRTASSIEFSTASVVVPYGSFDEAARVHTKQTLNGTMAVEVDYYGQILRARLRFQSVVEQTWWGVEDVGVVKTASDLLIRMAGGGRAIGYEIIASLVIPYIIKMALFFANESRKPSRKQFHRP